MKPPVESSHGTNGGTERLRYYHCSTHAMQVNKDFKNNDIDEIYIHYHQLFNDSYDENKYAVTPTKLYRTGFSLFEDSALEDNRDAISVNGESSGSSDEAKQTNMLGLA
ncbi:uncharacterized protein LOC111373190 [Olea europaea var. sylvestris]|uniref:uncharacterized protein LOC111373190 n=1 Tax=Olea europaea var. sylvestris TaxID=158386 RepID=UPI000C1CE9B1|nr:uncharacterized protein LOC111373190 [Olea europaea var. sylvestris]